MKNGPQKKYYMKNAIHIIACSLVLARPFGMAV
jgi:hypothetical protein